MHDVRMTRRTLGHVAGLTVDALAAGMPAMRAAAQEATPDATPAARPVGGRLAGMLALAPASYPWVDDPASMVISYADFATQLAVTETPPVDSMDDPNLPHWIGATRALAVPSNPAQYLSYWREDYGFDLFQADETLELALPPFNLTLYRGRFDRDAIRARLTEGGYTSVDVNGHEILTLRDDYEQDLTSPFAYKLAAMNHIAFLDDGTIASASVQAALVAVLDVAAGTAPSMMEQAGVATLVGQAPADLVSATIVNGTALAGNLPADLIDLEPGATPDFDVIATQVAQTSEMPPVVLALVGSTAGGPLFGEDIETPAGVPDAHGIALALMLTPESAEAAVPVVEERLETGELANTSRPLSEYFPDHDVRAVPLTPVLIVDLTIGPETPPNILISMLFNRDLSFLAW
jgi:hypothetical protein